MKIYPYARNDSLLEEIAVREANCGLTEWDPDDLIIEPKIIDPLQPICIEARVVADLSAVAEKGILPDGEELDLIAVLNSPATRWSKVIKEWPLKAGGKEKFHLEPFPIAIDPDHLSGKMHLRFILCLAADRAKVDSYARKKWNILARKDFTFPETPTGGSITDWKSFRNERLPEGLWHIHIPGNDLGQPATKIRIWLNSDNNQFKRLMSKSSLTKQDRVMGIKIMQKMIRASLLQEIVTMAIVSELDIEEKESEGTCWSLGMTFCQRLFPDDWDPDQPWESFKAIRVKYKGKLPEIATMAQSDSGIGDYLSGGKILNPGGAS